MVDRNEELIGEIAAIAIFPGKLPSLTGIKGVRFRSRQKGGRTLVPCRIDTLDGRSVATPLRRVPQGTAPPRFRLQFVSTRTSVEERRAVCVVLSGEKESWKADPEQTLLSPIFDDGYRMIYEFTRAYVVRVDKRGEIESRFVAIDAIRGIVGTKTVHRFDLRLLALTTRCGEYLRGEIDIFPLRETPNRYQNETIPQGEAALNFAVRSRSKPQPRPPSDLQESANNPTSEI